MMNPPCKTNVIRIARLISKGLVSEARAEFNALPKTASYTVPELRAFAGAVKAAEAKFPGFTWGPLFNNN